MDKHQDLPWDWCIWECILLFQVKKSPVIPHVSLLSGSRAIAGMCPKEDSFTVDHSFVFCEPLHHLLLARFYSRDYHLCYQILD